MRNAKKIKLSASEGKTFQDGFEEYVLDMKARNLRSGTITHYKESIKQIYKEQFPNFREVPDFSTNLYSNPLEPETPQIVPNGMSIVKEAVA